MLKQISKDLEHLAGLTATREGFEIVGFKIFAEIKPMTIQIQIRHQNGEDVSLDDCSKFSGSVGESIDNSELLNIPHVLEVSSPGLTEVLQTDKDFITFKGFPIEVATKSKSNSQIIESGLLHTRSKEHLKINIKGKISKIPRDEVIQVRLVSPTE